MPRPGRGWPTCSASSAGSSPWTRKVLMKIRMLAIANGKSCGWWRRACRTAISREEKIIEKVKAETAPYLQKRWQELADHPLVGEARGVGMVAALELVKNKKTRERFTDKGVGMLCREHCFRNGLIMRAVGDTMIISPPLVIDPSQIDELITLARKCLDQTAAAVLA